MQISALRRILDEGRTEGSCIQTVAARGYRFIARSDSRSRSPEPRPAHLCHASRGGGRLAFPNLCDDPEQEYFADGHHRRFDDGSVMDAGVLRNFPQHRIYLQGQTRRRQADRTRARRHYVIEGSVRTDGRPNAK